MAYGDYQLLQIDVKGGIATAVVDAPPINVMTVTGASSGPPTGIAAIRRMRAASS